MTSAPPPDDLPEFHNKKGACEYCSKSPGSTTKPYRVEVHAVTRLGEYPVRGVKIVVQADALGATNADGKCPDQKECSAKLVKIIARYENRKEKLKLEKVEFEAFLRDKDVDKSPGIDWHFRSSIKKVQDVAGKGDKDFIDTCDPAEATRDIPMDRIDSEADRDCELVRASTIPFAAWAKNPDGSVVLKITIKLATFSLNVDYISQNDEDYSVTTVANHDPEPSPHNHVVLESNTPSKKFNGNTLCYPTSTAMLLRYWDIDACTPGQVMQKCYDEWAKASFESTFYGAKRLDRDSDRCEISDCSRTPRPRQSPPTAPDFWLDSGKLGGSGYEMKHCKEIKPVTWTKLGEIKDLPEDWWTLYSQAKPPHAYEEGRNPQPVQAGDIKKNGAKFFLATSGESTVPKRPVAAQWKEITKIQELPDDWWGFYKQSRPNRTFEGDADPQFDPKKIDGQRAINTGDIWKKQQELYRAGNDSHQWEAIPESAWRVRLEYGSQHVWQYPFWAVEAMEAFLGDNEAEFDKLSGPYLNDLGWNDLRQWNDDDREKYSCMPLTALPDPAAINSFFPVSDITSKRTEMTAQKNNLGGELADTDRKIQAEQNAADEAAKQILEKKNTAKTLMAGPAKNALEREIRTLDANRDKSLQNKASLERERERLLKQIHGIESRDQYLAGMLSEYDPTDRRYPVLRRYLDFLREGHPFIVGTQATGSGHMMVVRGAVVNRYLLPEWLIINDPYGNLAAESAVYEELSLSSSVGVRGTNQHDDVINLQEVLKAISRYKAGVNGEVLWDPLLVAIIDYQATVRDDKMITGTVQKTDRILLDSLREALYAKEPLTLTASVGLDPTKKGANQDDDIQVMEAALAKLKIGGASLDAKIKNYQGSKKYKKTGYIETNDDTYTALAGDLKSKALSLTDAVGELGKNNLADVMSMRRALGAIDYVTFPDGTPDPPPDTPYSKDPLISAIMQYQKDKKLTVTGIVVPDDETLKQIRLDAGLTVSYAPRGAGYDKGGKKGQHVYYNNESHGVSNRLRIKIGCGFPRITKTKTSDEIAAKLLPGEV